MRPLSIYIHIPFCERRCPYCDFHSGVAGDAEIAREISSTIAQIRADAPRASGMTVNTIYIGGGTPSFVDVAHIGAIMDALRANYTVENDAEITIEVNPQSLSDAKLRAYRSFGINRISIGVQSFSNRGLRILGRLHNVATAKNAIKMAAQHFQNTSIDIIHSIPRARVVLPRRYLRMVKHVSAYCLTTPSNGTQSAERLFSNPMSDEKSIRQQQKIERVLSKCGIEKYEVSNFARPGFKSRHNITYWTCGEWLGFGTGAHGHFGEPWSACDKIMLGLRLVGGVPREIIANRDKEIAELESLGLVTTVGGRVACTSRGFLVLNQIILKLSQ